MRNRYWRKNKAVLTALAVLLCVCLLYIVLPPVLAALVKAPGGPHRLGAVLPGMWERALECLIAVWFFMLGGAIGSFLNVVVWRMPLGMSIAAGGSRCPFCRTAILSSDNIPIFGWLKLRGRCRACRLPISPRYPLVELTLAAAFLMVAVTELYFACYTLPWLSPPWLPGFDRALATQRWDIFGLYVYHVVLLTLLTGATLFAFDGNRVPRSYLMFSAMVALLAVVWPVLHPPSGWELLVEGIPHRGAAALSVLTGAVAGGVCGLLLMLVLRTIAGPVHPSTVVWMLMCTGAFLGWKMVLLAGPLAMLISCITLPAAARKWPAGVHLPAGISVATLVLLLHAGEFTGMPTGWIPPGVFAITTAVLWLLLAVLLGYVTCLCHIDVSPASNADETRPEKKHADEPYVG